MANTKDAAAPKTYSYAVAKDVLSDTEKNRCLCLFLNMDHSVVDWKKATEAFDCASVESMRVMTRTTLKKIAEAEKNGGVPTPTKAKSAAGKKRKAAAAAADGDDEAQVPAKKGKGGGKKKADTPVEDEDEESGKSGVKAEDEDEF